MSKDPLREYLRSLPEWSNKHRVASLFADLNRLRSINPVAYEANVAFWKAVVTKSAEQNWPWNSHALVMTAEELAERAERDGVRPIGLGTVLAELQKSGHAVPLLEYLNRPTGVGGIARRILTRLVWDPLVWTWRQIGFGHDREAEPEGGIETRRFILTSAVSRLADRLLQRHYETSTYAITDNLMSMSELRSQLFSRSSEMDIPISSTDEEILLRYWETNGLATVMSGDAHGLVSMVKFCEKDRRNAKNLEITTADRGIVQIKETRRSVSRQVDDLEEKISALTAKAREDVKVPHRKPLVLSSLRRKKLLHEILEKRIQSLETLDAVFVKLQNAASDAEILQAYKVGADTLQSVLKASGLDVESVDAALEKLSEAMADQKEIEDAIHSGGTEIRSAAGVDDLDEEELERELEELAIIADGKERESGKVSSNDVKKEIVKTSEQLSGLPDVPSRLPGTVDAKSEEVEKEREREEAHRKRETERTPVLA